MLEDNKQTKGLSIGRDLVFKQFKENAITAEELESYLINDIEAAKSARMQLFKKAIDNEKDRVLASISNSDLDDVKFVDKIAGLKVLSSISRIEDGQSTGNISIKWAD